VWQSTSLAYSGVTHYVLHYVLQSQEVSLVMPSSLNIRNIGQDRKAALEAEAKATGASISDIVREWIDAGITKSRAERARDAWITSAKQGIADETRHLELSGPSLARFRRAQTRTL
jgi:post-segregation antitoxin (ccd killing protein)